MKSLPSSGKANAASSLRLCLNLIRVFACWLIAASNLEPVSAATPQVATQFDFSSDTTPGARKFYFETIPGHRYTLWRSTDLTNWAPVPGYPQTAAGLSIEHTFAQDTKEFFRVEPIDEQSPAVESQYPAVDGFAVGRFADLSIELSDATGIDPATIRLTVGASGQLAPGAPGLTISGNTITYDSGDAALGAWGVTLSATLIVSDTLGHTLTHTWTFRLEPEPQVAANIFVFGSPTAQRAGQRVSGPAAALASRYPTPVGPQKANDPPPWSIDSVLGDRIVIAYQAGGKPAFIGGQLICNLAPAKESEIFYRRVLSTSDDPVNLKLTVFTEEAPLTAFVSQGAAAFTEESVVFETDGTGTLVSAIAVSGEKTFPRIGFNLSGSRLKLRPDGFESEVMGQTMSLGEQQPWIDIEATNWAWYLTPTLRAGFDIRWGDIESFEAVASGNLEIDSAFDVSILMTGAKTETTIFDWPKHLEPKHVVFMGAIGPVPVYGVLAFDFKVKSKATAQALLDYSFSYQQSIRSSFGFRYSDADGVEWVRSFQPSAPSFSQNVALTGTASLEITLVPEPQFLLYGAGGFLANIEPHAGIEVSASTNGSYGGKLDAGVDFTLAIAGPAFAFLPPGLEFVFPIWEGEWPITNEELTFKNHPQSRTVTPGDDVSFTCTVDSPAAPTFQWYHKGVPIPGQISRTLSIYNMTSGHAGSYYIRAKAGGQTVDSNTATLTVQTATPQNLDADGDGIPNIHETNTGTWVSTTNRGTDPYKWDSDGDGLSDGVETNTRIYVSRSNTGTDPNNIDTDGDGNNDKREIDLGTDPNVPPTPPAPDGFALIPAGSFQMGQDGIATPVHSVYVSAFYMGKYEVTKELWDTVRAWGLNNGYTDLPVGNGSYASKGTNHPVHSISWYAMVKWCNARSQKENLTPCYTVSGSTYKTGNSAPDCNWSANGYRLPSEAEWEKAARGGVSGKNFPWGMDTITHSQANYYSSSSYAYDVSPTRNYHPTYAVGNTPYSSPVGSFASNGYGLYDMAGNMWEWCWDWYSSSYYTSSPGTDPRGAASGAIRVVRGGSLYDGAGNCRAAHRDSYGNPGFTYFNFGFRMARSSVP